jgi:hypothetical protein
LIAVRTVLFVLLAVMVAGGMLYRQAFPEVTWHQKLRMTIDTPNGTITADSIVKVGFVEPLPIGGRRVNSGVAGEALVAVIRDGVYLVALLKKQEALAPRTFIKEIGVEGPRSQRAKWPDWARNITRLEGRKSVPHDHYPMLVTFADPDNPMSVRRVDPDNLAASFGPGHRLVALTLEITDEPVTEGRIDKVLPWLDGLDGGYLDGGRTSKGAPLGLHGGQFRTTR